MDNLSSELLKMVTAQILKQAPSIAESVVTEMTSAGSSMYNYMTGKKEKCKCKCDCHKKEKEMTA